MTARPAYPAPAQLPTSIRLLEIERALMRFLDRAERIELVREYNELWTQLEREAEAA